MWLRFDDCFMTMSDRSALTDGGMLNDMHVNCAQQLLLRQFPSTNATLYQNKLPQKKIEEGVQIIHDRGNR